MPRCSLIVSLEDGSMVMQPAYRFLKNATLWACIAGVLIAYVVVAHGAFLLGAGFKIAATSH